MAMKIKPLDDRVVVEATRGRGEDQGRDRPPRSREGEAAAGTRPRRRPGPPDRGRQAHPADVKKGDTVVYGKYSGTDVKVEGTEYKIMRESEILAKFS